MFKIAWRIDGAYRAMKGLYKVWPSFPVLVTLLSFLVTKRPLKICLPRIAALIALLNPSTLPSANYDLLHLQAVHFLRHLLAHTYSAINRIFPVMDSMEEERSITDVAGDSFRANL